MTDIPENPAPISNDLNSCPSQVVRAWHYRPDVQSTSRPPSHLGASGIPAWDNHERGDAECAGSYRLAALHSVAAGVSASTKKDW